MRILARRGDGMLGHELAERIRLRDHGGHRDG
ncbi:hypothetical protein FraEuI1c_2249 [Pseudofrankia inefficax]|uniref:Uncharacterized protein n=1 Tax=Pseudofrankia inefficax (strain DSM 45817 / CECT 9037 / DDB 130130 / EuI1c) TaxID=298654 RepID=E3IZ05_PSEI1|nr:hypothetical protein FraEuI1c_2249 [Pseudofrankia inefficax]